MRTADILTIFKLDENRMNLMRLSTWTLSLTVQRLILMAAVWRYK
jgi:hypothetical protein